MSTKPIIAYFIIVVWSISGVGLNLIIAAPLPYGAATCGATDITSNSATLIGKAYDDFASSSSPMIAWFDYGTASGLYSGTSTTQNVTSGTVAEISIGVSGLSPNTLYCYRITAQSPFGISLYGHERSFITLPTTSTAIGRTQTISNYSPDCHAASGKVTDVITGKGIEKAMVIGGGLGGIFFTNEDGFYSWSDPEEIMCCGNTYTLIASADGYISQEKSIDIEPQVEGTLNFELRPSTNVCAVKKITLSPGKLMLKRGQSDEVTVTLDGDNCIPIHEMVAAKIKFGNRCISVSPLNAYTDTHGQAVFTIIATNRTGIAKVTFKANGLKESIIVKVRK